MANRSFSAITIGLTTDITRITALDDTRSPRMNTMLTMARRTMASPEPISGPISSMTTTGPWVLAGFTTINTGATDPRAGAPNDSGGINKVPGDWHETMSTHWFHDHMFTFTDQNVYKCNAGMNNIYSSLDRGDETVNDGVNLRLPSGSSNGRAGATWTLTSTSCSPTKPGTPMDSSTWTISLLMVFWATR